MTEGTIIKASDPDEIADEVMRLFDIGEDVWNDDQHGHYRFFKDVLYECTEHLYVEEMEPYDSDLPGQSSWHITVEIRDKDKARQEVCRRVAQLG